MFYNTISVENKKAATAFYLKWLHKCLSFSVFLLIVPTICFLMLAQSSCDTMSAVGRLDDSV